MKLEQPVGIEFIIESLRKHIIIDLLAQILDLPNYIEPFNIKNQEPSKNYEGSLLSLYKEVENTIEPRLTVFLKNIFSKIPFAMATLTNAQVDYNTNRTFIGIEWNIGPSEDVAMAIELNSDDLKYRIACIKYDEVMMGDVTTTSMRSEDDELPPWFISKIKGLVN